ncbi:Asp-tRNA(Asn)/Glu-tRNA(Gln) amidotransferase subunit GatB [Planctomicrobium piriforme]|uniref:Aspartyl/glutamyl-tRNA(Asn/Gln) amidotransferase subunit B n=1 Tax=Planctomicrobium piriforme TaxID=1576369 RepID=A0A1I3DFR0_9PLAN|nr:Asp-tRNA(Asn)/Glu-tRNA(Gln) amidotransferase subunit GatB [Planctomicrobium piriforme]SFH85564.1 aspartyl-tRNA(Asn)/glutamyl-tRNA(Gln) amidotransferase subunit B [Planctomicrobium piriforme]
MSYTTVIGLEVHVQLQTKTKIFCSCVNRFNPDAPNTQTCPVCLGLPGSLPVLNQEAFELSLVTALALNCQIAPFTKWDRKQYYYPDLPKGYQISQYDLPFSHDGWLAATAENGVRRKIRIRRAHLEEDAGKNIHDESGRGSDSQVDLNRAGTPLLEIVTEPDIRSAAEAKSFLEEIHLLLTFLGVSDCNMQEGSLRCDANVNLQLQDGSATPIVEIKNLNTFRGVEAAITFEAERQLQEYEKTGRKLGDAGVEKQTRGWDAHRGLTYAQRGKEEASDYRYFPDPDLLPVTVSAERIASIKTSLPRLPAQRREDFESKLGLSTYDTDVIMNQGPTFADYFQQAVEVSGNAKQTANWMTQEVLRELNEKRISIQQFPMPSGVLGSLVKHVVDGEISVKSAREIFNTGMHLTFQDVPSNFEGIPTPPPSLTPSWIQQEIATKGLKIVSDTGALDNAIAAALAESAKAIEDFRSGKQQALGAVIGKVMKQVKGADPKTVRELIIQKLNS